MLGSHGSYVCGGPARRSSRESEIAAPGSAECAGHKHPEVRHNSRQHATINSFLAEFILFNPLSSHDALKHHFTSLKTDLIFPQHRVLERKFP